MTNLTKKRGRHTWYAGAQSDLQRQLYEHPDNRKVFEAVSRIALDDEHRNQAAAQKITSG